MLRNLKRKRKGKGFTLIELIIVIAIIAIISAIAVPKLLASKKDADTKADIANAKTIANAYMNAVADATIDPTGLSGTITTGEILSSATGSTTMQAIKVKLQSVPTTNVPKGGNFYVVADTAGGIKIIRSNTGKTAMSTEATDVLFPQ